MQSRLMTTAALFLFIYALTLTLSPSVRFRSWQVDYRWLHWIGFLVWLVAFALVHRQTARHLPDRDPYLLPIAALLSGWGLLSIWRLDTTFGLRQTLWLAICLLLFGAGAGWPQILALLRRFKYLWLSGGLLLTALTFLFGTFPGGEGPRLWLGCCGVYLQPSEPLKLFLIVYLAAYLADKLPISLGWPQIISPTLIVTGLALGILLIQRDLGTATLFLLQYFLMLFLASGKRRILVAGGLTMLAAGMTGYHFIEIIQNRVNAWLNPWFDPSGRSYQIIQSLLAIANGGIIGRGAGLGSPGVVPIAHSDFIFSAIAEETGLLGSLGVVVLLALLTGRGLAIALRASNTYERYLAGGLTTYFILQSIFIIGGNIGLLPLTGVTLPFVSYGGSSLLVAFTALLLLSQISNRMDEETLLIHDPRPFYRTGLILLGGLAAIAILNGWWVIARAENLLTRTDNPRRSIEERYVLRGALLDRKNRPISLSSGEPGQYTRQVLAPELGTLIGYSHPVYGQAGLEAQLDLYLRGRQGAPASLIWSNHLLYGMSPPGLDVRLSLDLDLQQTADQLLTGVNGAIVLLNAENGEILAMSSHPTFDPNLLGEKWNEWMQDANAPFLNRATQARYPPGSALSPFLLAATGGREITLPTLPFDLSATIDGKKLDCLLPISSAHNWGTAIANGCPAAFLLLGEQMTSEQLASLYQALGFDQSPIIPLPTAGGASLDAIDDPHSILLGQSESAVTPLQMALAAAAISAQGVRPQPLLATAVLTPHQGWVILPAEESTPSLAQQGVEKAANLLAVNTLPTWQSLGGAPARNGQVTWFVAGTLPDWQGAPLALAVALETDDPLLAQTIGNRLLQATMQPTP